MLSQPLSVRIKFSWLFSMGDFVDRSNLLLYILIREVLYSYFMYSSTVPSFTNYSSVILVISEVIKKHLRAKNIPVVY